MRNVRLVEACSETWDLHYKGALLPWKSSGVSRVDMELLERYAGRSFSVMDLGCGDGADSRFFVRRGCDYLGIDFSHSAVAMASQSNPTVCFEHADFFCWKPSKPYQVAYDKGLFHGLGGEPRRAAFAEHLASLLVTDGVWLSVCGAADRRRIDEPHGAIYLSDFVGPVEVFFEIIDVRKGPYGLEDASLEFDAWHVLSRRR